MDIQKKTGGKLGAIFLIAATCFGQGSAGLPLYVELGGFSLGIVLSIVIWLTMLASGFLLLEILSQMPHGTHFASIGRTVFGAKGGAICAGLFLLLNVIYLISYFPYQGQIQVLSVVFTHFLDAAPAPLTINIVFLLVFGTIAYLGTWVTDRLNFICMVGFLLAMLYVVFLGRSEIDPSRLTAYNWPFFLLAAPSYVDSFSYQTIVPNLPAYTRSSPKQLRKVLFFGTLIALFSYLIWTGFLITTADIGSFWEAFDTNDTYLFNQKSPLFNSAPYLFFSMFNLFASILATSIGFIQLLGDVFRTPRATRTQKDYLKYTLLAFLPAAIIGSLFPNFYNNFLYPLSIFLEIGLLIVFPIFVVWIFRYGENKTAEPLLPGGRISLLILLLISFYLFFFRGILTVST